MLTRRIRFQVVLFIVIALVGVSFVAVRYVGLDRYVRSDGYRVGLELPEAGGIFTNAEVTYRGVPVGRVGALTLSDDGVVARLDIEADAPPIPADVAAVVANRSAIGEQYVDLRPDTSEGPYLRDGSVIVGGPEALPPKVEVLLRDSRDFAASVPVDDLRTVVDELYLATRDAADPLRRLLETSSDLITTADRSLPATRSLIESSGTVLETQEQSAESIRSFSRDLRTFSRTLESSDRDFRRLLTTAPDAAEELQALFTQVGQPLGVVMGNLISTARVFGTNAEGVREVMVQLPRVIDAGYAVTGTNGLQVGVVTNFFQPLPCTEGYGATQLRQGTDVSPGEPLSLEIGCTAPASRTNARGSQHAPLPQAPLSVPTTLSSPSELAELLGGSLP